ncbi:TIGR03086 family metal-binding protein [uncultured Phycicoccus sp.]|uniref:TIGR03086 family metal-binding protein n=1 Tax=uncultured Phycicoccus sp. TaxID=661422 RepID=UPI002629E4CD|nr:TIGR03086 family metal-binding protein [uncultured Phycicoccus sp.]
MTYTNSVDLPVTPDEAFALLTEAERLRRWQTVSAVVDLRAGGAYRWTVTPGHIAAGTVREVEPGRRLVLGWGWEGSDDVPPDASTVTVTVEPHGDGSRVTLQHEGLSAVEAEKHALGWAHYLERLQRVAATGDAGPDEWAWAPDELTPTTAAEAALAALQPVLRGLTIEDQPRPTPCTEFTCHDLVVHLIGSLTQLAGMAGHPVDPPDTGSAENRVTEAAAHAIAAWRRVDPDSMVPVGDGEAPAAVIAGVLPLELVLHGWDIAQASGQDLRLSDEVVAYVRGLAEAVVPGGRGRSFADEVPPAAGASPLDALAAYAGRTPIAA